MMGVLMLLFFVAMIITIYLWVKYKKESIACPVCSAGIVVFVVGGSADQLVHIEQGCQECGAFQKSEGSVLLAEELF